MGKKDASYFVRINSLYIAGSFTVSFHFVFPSYLRLSIRYEDNTKQMGKKYASYFVRVCDYGLCLAETNESPIISSFRISRFFHRLLKLFSHCFLSDDYTGNIREGSISVESSDTLNCSRGLFQDCLYFLRIRS